MVRRKIKIEQGDRVRAGHGPGDGRPAAAGGLLTGQQAGQESGEERDIGDEQDRDTEHE